MFNLIHTSSKPKYTVRATMTSTDSGGVQSTRQALSLRVGTTSPLSSRCSIGDSVLFGDQNQDIRVRARRSR
jgi:hypothetical protein